MKQSTILGGKGFIGSHLKEHLSASGNKVWVPLREDPEIFCRDLGTVFYCAGVTSDFMERPFDTVRAHVNFLTDILEKATFRSFLYLSSARIYQYNVSTKTDTAVTVNPLIKSDLYNISKVMGESVCLSVNDPAIRIVRISNVYGKEIDTPDFLATVLRQVIRHGKIQLRSTLSSAKDYVHIQDVIEVLPEIAHGGRQRIYNIASGINTTNKVLLDAIRQVTECEIEVTDKAVEVVFPRIDIQPVAEEFGFEPRRIEHELPKILNPFLEGKFYETHL